MADRESALQRLWEEGRAAWPDIELPASDFASYLTQRMPEGTPPEQFLEEARAADLYLACACARGVPAALVALDRSILSRIPTFVAQVDASPSFADEVRQCVRERLLVATEERAARIAEYGGRGALANWVRAVAYRTALNLRRGRGDRMAQRLDENTLETLTIAEEPEVGILRARHEADFREALRDAFRQLPADQRNAMRLHYAYGMTADQIAATLKVHRATALRWLGGARQGMLKQTRRLLRERLRLPENDVDSFIRVMRSTFRQSLTSLVREPL